MSLFAINDYIDWPFGCGDGLTKYTPLAVNEHKKIIENPTCSSPENLLYICCFCCCCFFSDFSIFVMSQQQFTFFFFFSKTVKMVFYLNAVKSLSPNCHFIFLDSDLFRVNIFEILTKSTITGASAASSARFSQANDRKKKKIAHKLCV